MTGLAVLGGFVLDTLFGVSSTVTAGSTPWPSTISWRRLCMP